MFVCVCLKCVKNVQSEIEKKLRDILIHVQFLCRSSAMILMLSMISMCVVIRAADDVPSIMCVIRNATDMQNACSDSTVRYLKFADMQLHRLPDMFTAYPHMLSLDVSSVNCSLLDNTTFARAANLTDLQLFNNSLTAVGDRVFSHMHALLNLNLGLNKIRTLDEHAFNGLISLNLLDLSMNDLDSLPEGVFFPLLKLHSIRLTKNRIQVIDDTTFAHNSALKLIYLDKNNINFINDRAFAQNKALRDLKVNNNLVTSSGFLREITAHLIDVTNNSFTSLFISKNARKVQAANNQIVRIEIENATMFAIEDLLLSDNHLSHLEDFTPLAGIIVLNLARNKITTVNGTRLSGMTVRQLNLIGNNLTAFNATGIKQFLPNLKLIELTVTNWPSNVAKSIIDQFTAQGVYVTNGNVNIVNQEVSTQISKANLTDLFPSPTSTTEMPMADSPADGHTSTSNHDDFSTSLRNITGGKSNEEVIRIIQASQEHAEHNETMRKELRNLKIVITLFSVVFIALISLKVAIFVKERYFQHFVVGNTFRSPARFDDSFNPIIEDHL